MKKEKELFITAYMWMFGETKKSAINTYEYVIGVNDRPYIKEIINGYLVNTAKKFMED